MTKPLVVIACFGLGMSAATLPLFTLTWVVTGDIPVGGFLTAALVLLASGLLIPLDRSLRRAL